MVILAYHKINDTGADALSVSCANFARQMEYLSRRHYRVVTLAEFVRRHRGLPRKTAVITFDDGYRDNFVGAYPVLKRYRYPATIFLISAYTGKTYGGEKMLSWEEIKMMQKDGFSFGSHTHTHPHLTGVSEEDLVDELQGSRQILEENLKSPVKFFVPPYGEYSPAVREAAKNAGYEKVLITPPKRFAFYSDEVLRRRGVYRHNGMAVFCAKLFLGESPL